jgi:hypothetical protein
MLDNWFIIAAGNLGVEDNTDVNEMDDALNDRFIHFNVSVEVNPWLEWAKSANIHPDIIGFIETKPGYLHKKNKEDDQVFLTPRSWEKFSDILKLNNDIEPKKITEILGPSIINGAAAAFTSWLNSKVIVKPEEVLNSFKKVKPRIEAMQRDQIYSLNIELASYIAQNWKNFITDELKENSSKNDKEAKEKTFKITNKKFKKWIYNVHDYVHEILEKDIYVAFMQTLMSKIDEYNNNDIGHDFLDYYLSEFDEESQNILKLFSENK